MLIVRKVVLEILLFLSFLPSTCLFAAADGDFAESSEGAAVDFVEEDEQDLVIIELQNGRRLASLKALCSKGECFFTPYKEGRFKPKYIGTWDGIGSLPMIVFPEMSTKVFDAILKTVSLTVSQGLSYLYPQQSSQEPKKKKRRNITFEINSVSFDFVPVPEGDYTMGSPETEIGRYSNEVQRQVHVDSFYMLRTPLTQAQWKVVMGELNEQIREGEIRGDNYPLFEFSFDAVLTFITLINEKLRAENLQVRFPTEEEWEFAARAGSTERFPWGNDESRLGEFVWGAHNSDGHIHPVASLAPNAFGLYDMLGNVYEMLPCPREEPAYSLVGRGGDYRGRPNHVRSARRQLIEPPTNIFKYLVSFRLVVERLEK